MRDREDAPIELRVSVLAARMDAMERDLRAHARNLEDIGRAVDALRLQDEVAAGVRQALSERQESQANLTAHKVQQAGVGLSLTWWQKLSGALAAVILIIDAARGFI